MDRAKLDFLNYLGLRHFTQPKKKKESLTSIYSAPARYNFNRISRPRISRPRVEIPLIIEGKRKRIAKKPFDWAVENSSARNLKPKRQLKQSSIVPSTKKRATKVNTFNVVDEQRPTTSKNALLQDCLQAKKLQMPFWF